MTGQAKETVLLVEDYEPLREVISSFLENKGYAVLKARNDAEALVISAAHPGSIPLMVTDVELPGMSGPELAQRLVGLRPGMKVVFLSGFIRDSATHKKAVQKPGTAFLQKPFELETLARKIDELLGVKGGNGRASDEPSAATCGRVRGGGL